MTPNDLEKMLNQYESKVFDIVDASMRGAMNQVEVLTHSRIFDDTQKVDKSQIGNYKSEEYIKYRKKKGKQVSRVDLQLTGTLSRSFESVVSSQGWSVILKPTPYKKGGVTTNKVARYQDERYGKIFYANKQEIDEGVRVANQIFYERTKQVFKLR
jgi:hypothetical protein